MKKQELESIIGKDLYARAKEVLGNSTNTIKWFEKPRTAFDGKTPLEIYRVNKREEIYDLLGRIENGVFY